MANSTRKVAGRQHSAIQFSMRSSRQPDCTLGGPIPQKRRSVPARRRFQNDRGGDVSLCSGKVIHPRRGRFFVPGGDDSLYPARKRRWRTRFAEFGSSHSYPSREKQRLRSKNRRAEYGRRRPGLLSLLPNRPAPPTRGVPMVEFLCPSSNFLRVISLLCACVFESRRRVCHRACNNFSGAAQLQHACGLVAFRFLIESRRNLIKPYRE